MGAADKEYIIKKTILSVFLDIIYESFMPHVCLFCKKPMEQDSFVCNICEGELVYASKAQNLTYISKIYAAFTYSEFSRLPIFRLKYAGKTMLAKPLAKIISSEIEFIEVDIIVPVPLHVNRLKERGYNQAALIACELSLLLNIPAYDIIMRIKDTEKQFNLQTNQKWSNVEGAFNLKVGVDIKDKTILIVDDILTTGATIFQCASLLVESGAKNIYVAVFACGNINL